MSIRAVVVGINHWDDLTFPFITQLNDHNPFEVFVVDNGSSPPYPVPSRSVLIKVKERIGYGEALNIGASAFSLKDRHDWDWLLCCNNDCLCTGRIDCSHLRTDTVYGNAWKYDYEGMADGLPAVVDSAYLVIPRKIWERLGGFDPKMDAAFEEIDLQIRALDCGYRVDVAELPITHLNVHTRWELPDYGARWSRTLDYFKSKHPARNANAGAGAQEVRHAIEKG